MKTYEECINGAANFIEAQIKYVRQFDTEQDLLFDRELSREAELRALTSLRYYGKPSDLQVSRTRSCVRLFRHYGGSQYANDTS